MARFDMCVPVLLVCALFTGVLGANNQEAEGDPFQGTLYQTDGIGPDPAPPFVSGMDYPDSDLAIGAPPLGEVIWVAIPLQGQNGEEEDDEEEEEINGEASNPASDESLEPTLARRKRSLEEGQEKTPETARPKRNSQPKSKPITRWVTVRRSNFVPRLGKRADEETQNVDWTSYPEDHDDAQLLAAELEDPEAPSGERYLRSSYSFSPRLGRTSFSPRLGRSDPDLTVSSEVPLEDEELSISTRAGGYLPRSGTRASFVPRLGKRGRSFAPRLGKRGRSFAPRLGKRGRSFTPRLGKRANSFVPRLGKRGGRFFSPRLGRSTFVPRLGRSDPALTSPVQWST
ncbi:uncharacterized protein LOC143027910 isoform X2 [Oratosquilla oratoria]|uniref:uncharacterized protein LOC143027910 isoform X2 n=1 Tax=Oratosquilla oratoria TaxID=337810 RepID=UPI003F76A39C